MTDCPPGAFCPDHPSIPFAAALTALALLGLATLALPLLGVTALIRRTRRSRPVPQETAAHIIATALDEWWITTDPLQTFNTTAVAQHIDTCLREAGHLPPAVTEGTQL